MWQGVMSVQTGVWECVGVGVGLWWREGGRERERKERESRREGGRES